MSHFKNPMMWNDEEEADILSPIGKEENLSDPLGLSAISSLSSILQPIDFECLKTSEIVELLQNICLSLEKNQHQCFSLHALSLTQKQSLYNLLGEGEVHIHKENNDSFKAYETSFIGLWLVQDGPSEDYLEIADFPQALKLYIAEQAITDFNLPSSAPTGCMNILGLFSEIEQKYKDRHKAKENYIINFSLFPMNEADADFLAQNLGYIGLKITSKGYSEAIVRPTFIRDIYSLQYQNNQGKVILDTIEIGDLPSAILATCDDFKTTEQRLVEIIKLYQS